MALTSMVAKFLALVAIWLVMVMTALGDSMKEFGQAIDDRAVLEGAVYVEPGLLPRDGQLTVTVTDTVCATQGTGIPPTTLITASLPPTVTLTSVTPPSVTSECHSSQATANTPSEPPSMSTAEHTSGPTIPSSTIVASGSQPGSTHVDSQTTGATIPSSSPVTSAEHSGSHSISSQTTGSACTRTAPSTSHSSTAPPLSNDAFAQGGMQGALLALGLTFAGFMAI